MPSLSSSSLPHRWLAKWVATGGWNENDSYVEDGYDNEHEHDTWLERQGLGGRGRVL